MSEQTKQIGIDATELFCPEFTSPVMSLIKKHVAPGNRAVIKTKESRGLDRLKHLCASFDWLVVGYKHVGDTYYIAISV